MKTHRDPGSVENLLNAVLADDDWLAKHDRLKEEALAVLTSRRARRQQQRRITALAALALLAVGAIVIAWRPSHSSIQVAQHSSALAPSFLVLLLISEIEMMAMFPAGSCVVAEVDGRKKLVFLDPRIAQDGIVVAHP